MSTFLPTDGAHRKKINLMSIVESLHPESFWDRPPGSSNSIQSQTLNPSGNPTTTSSTRNPGIGPIIIDDEVVDSEEPTGREDDPLENLFSLLNGLASRTPAHSNPKDSRASPPENDETLLQMQHPPEGKKAGIQTLIQSYANGTSDVRSILNNDINFIYECKRCRGMFRSLPNLIRHKKEYCKNTGMLSSFMDRPTNSTQGEDESFKNFLDTLYPPEPPPYAVPLSSPPLKSRNGGLKPVPTTLSNLKPVRVNLVQMSSAAATTSTSYTVTNNKPGQVVPLRSTSTVTTSSNSGENLKVVVSQAAKPMQPAAKSQTAGVKVVCVPPALPEVKNICPICDKAFSGRKSVRRHLINVHMVSHNEAIKLMASFNPNKKTKGKLSGRTGASLIELAVETIKLAPNQIIHVLPQNVEISSAECPVCGRQLCRKSNVRRHLVEAHKMVIKNDNKYWKLREIASSNLSCSPSARALRSLFSADASTLSSAKSIPVSPETNSVQRVRHINVSKPIPLSILPLATTTTGTKKAGPLAINKVTFVESNPVLTSSMRILQALPSSAKPSTKSILPPKSSLLDEKQDKVKMLLPNGTTQSETSSLERSSVENDSPKPGSNSTKENDQNDADPTYKCSPCNKVFSRRQTYQNHMYTFHKSSGEELEKKINSQKTNSSNMLRKRSAYDGGEDCNSDNEPLQKLRKRRNTESNKQVVSFCSEDSDTDTMPLQKLSKLSSVFLPNEAKSSRLDSDVVGSVKQTKTGTSHLRSRSLSQDRTSGIDPSENVYMSQNPDTVPLATTTTILSSSIVNSGSSSEPQKEKVTQLTQNFVLRRLSLDNPRSSTVTMLRPIIKVQLKNSAVAAKSSGTNQNRKNASPQLNVAKGGVQYDFVNLRCHTCCKTFPNTPDLKSHLLSVHSLTEEEARSSCYDLSPVKKEVQEAGLEHGFDISQAKCLLCSRHYFSREILYKHLSRFHHLEDEVLEGLKASASPNGPKMVPVSNGNVRPRLNQHSKAVRHELSASSLLQELAASSTSQQPVKETSAVAKMAVAKLPVTPTRAADLTPFCFSKELAMEALKIFPKEYVNATALRCTKCKHRYHKTWDLKMHLLRHLKVGLFACRYCKGELDSGELDSKPIIVRSGDLIKHLAMEHRVRVTAKNREKYFAECRVNLTNLWEAYGLPVGKIK